MLRGDRGYACSEGVRVVSNWNGVSAVQSLDLLLNELISSSGLALTFTVAAAEAGVTEDRPGAILVHLKGPDQALLLERHAELLLALEHIACKALGLEPEEHERVSFDAGGFKQARRDALERSAAKAVGEVRASGDAFHFAPMNSRERRMLHLVLATSGFATRSEGVGSTRHLVLQASVSSG